MSCRAKLLTNAPGARCYTKGSVDVNARIRGMQVLLVIDNPVYFLYLDPHLHPVYRAEVKQPHLYREIHWKWQAVDRNDEDVTPRCGPEHPAPF